MSTKNITQANKSNKSYIHKLREQWQRQICRDGDLTLAARVVGVAISWHLNQYTGDAWPSQITVADAVAMTPRTVMRGAKQLETRGHLKVLRTRKDRKNDVNHYIPILQTANQTAVSSDTPDTSVVTRQAVSSDTPVTPTSDSSGFHQSRLKEFKEIKEVKESGEEVRALRAEDSLLLSQTTEMPGWAATHFDAIATPLGPLGKLTDRQLSDLLKRADPNVDVNIGRNRLAGRWAVLYQQVADAGAAKAVADWFKEIG